MTRTLRLDLNVGTSWSLPESSAGPVGDESAVLAAAAAAARTADSSPTGPALDSGSDHDVPTLRSRRKVRVTASSKCAPHRQATTQRDDHGRTCAEG